jgi:DNA-binding response OmpR family regulator
LVAEDEPFVTDSISRALAHGGFHVVGVTDGSAAWSAFAHGSFDLVIADWQMPGMNGAQLAAGIKAVRPNFPVILLSGFPELLDPAKPPPVDAIVTKPFAVDEILSLITKLLAQNPPTAPPP